MWVSQNSNPFVFPRPTISLDSDLRDYGRSIVECSVAIEREAMGPAQDDARHTLTEHLPGPHAAERIPEPS
jgi:hypothetical protein